MKLFKSFVIVLFLLVPFIIFGTSINGYLPVTIDWSIGSYVETVKFGGEMTDGFLTGNLQIADSTIPVRFAGGTDPVLIVDSDGDGIFEDEGAAELYLRETYGEQDTRFWKKKVKVSYVENGRETEKEILLRFGATKYGLYGDYSLEYWVSSHQEGVLYYNDTGYKIILFTSGSDGNYSVLSDVHFGIDRNLDGKIEFSVLSPEIYSAEDVIGFGGTNFKINDISRSGDLISLNPVKEEATYKPFLTPGNKAPEVEAEDVSGNSVKIPGNIITILILSPDVPDGTEESDYDGDSYYMGNIRLSEILSLPENWSAFNSKLTRIIWLLSGDRCSEACYEEIKNVSVVQNEDMLKIYGYKNAEEVFVIDSSGVIKATDEYWTDEKSMLTDHPQGGQLMLSAADIKKILLDLY